MLDIKLIRENQKYVKDNLKKRGYKEIKNVDLFIKLDKEWRELKSAIDSLRSERNKLTLEITKLSKKKEDVSKSIVDAKRLPIEIDKKGNRLNQIKEEMDLILHSFPNILHESVPVGSDENDNRVEYESGKKYNY